MHTNPITNMKREALADAYADLRATWQWKALVRERPTAVGLLRRLPFSLAMIAGIIVVGAATRSLFGAVPQHYLDSYGYSLSALLHGRAYTLFTMPFLALQPYMLVAIMAFMIVFVVLCEYLYGWWRTGIIYWTGHLGGCLLTSAMLLPFYHVNQTWAVRLGDSIDVGASAGAVACGAAIVAFLPRLFRRYALMAFVFWIGLFVVFDWKVYNLEHAFALPVGFLCGLVLSRRKETKDGHISTS